MARDFFDIHDGVLMRDDVGSECDGPESVRLAAMRVLPEMAKDLIPQDGDKQAFTVLVRNERNVTVYTASLTFSGLWIGEDAPILDRDPDRLST
ncbi:MAG: hypothetical protein K2Y56_17280 [Methylobacterium sp.]|uniref:DUF6894 family protein n=1 Tax=Methylobacterium sp. TaxID=409 RepID=UPI0025D835EF|nr:hypothetical protein [Methylobacterium sp.]MBX9933259.1 hypothetical protein [Methylobacterium sp.]